MAEFDDIIARYEITDARDEASWVDIREAKPRCRIRPLGERVVVTVDKDGAIEISGKHELDRYEDDKYKAIRDEVQE